MGWVVIGQGNEERDEGPAALEASVLVPVEAPRIVPLALAPVDCRCEPIPKKDAITEMNERTWSEPFLLKVRHVLGQR